MEGRDRQTQCRNRRENKEILGGREVSWFDAIKQESKFTPENLSEEKRRLFESEPSFKVDFPDLEDLVKEADDIHDDEQQEINKLRAKALGEPIEEEPKESAKDKASKLWKVDKED